MQFANYEKAFCDPIPYCNLKALSRILAIKIPTLTLTVMYTGTLLLQFISSMAVKIIETQESNQEKTKTETSHRTIPIYVLKGAS